MIALLYAALLFGLGYLCGLFRPLKYVLGLSGMQSNLQAKLDDLEAKIAAQQAKPPAAPPFPPQARIPPGG